MRHRSAVRATLSALNGERVLFRHYTERDATEAFLGYVRWLKSMEFGDCCLLVNANANHVVSFDTGGSVRFTSAPQHLDGVKPENILFGERP